MLTLSLFLAIFLGALVSGWHCALMCGGIAAAIERPLVKRAPLGNKPHLFYQQLVMHLGRITSYVVLGAMAAWLGARIWQQDWLPIQRPLFALTSCILIFMGYRLLRLNPIIGMGQAGSWFGSRLAGYWAKYLGGLASAPSRWFSGMLWGLLPCGLIYSVLPLALLSGDPLSGAGMMLAFGLGTLPNLLLISRFSALLTQFGQYPWVRYLAAGIMFLGGIWGLYRAWVLPEALLKGGFCFA